MSVDEETRHVRPGDAPWIPQVRLTVSRILLNRSPHSCGRLFELVRGMTIQKTKLLHEIKSTKFYWIDEKEVRIISMA